MQFWAIIVDSFRESLDRKIFWVIVALTLIVVVAMLCISFGEGKISMLFGVWEIETQSVDYNPLTEVGQAQIIDIAVSVMSIFLGWIGVLLMIIATASFFPTMMERGAIDVVLAKPISRPRLFLYKYLASMVFVLLQATLFIGLTFLVVGLRWGVWIPGYLLAIPLLIVLFSYLYCVSVLVGVATRSVIAAILLSIGAWLVFALPAKALDTLELFEKQDTTAYQALRVATWIVPKTSDIEYLAARYARAGNTADTFSEDMMPPESSREDREIVGRAHELDKKKRGVNTFYSLGSSLAFELVIVLLAMYKFTRRDF